jgi:hypothetical protein
MAKKKTPPEYGESDFSQSQYCCPDNHVMFGGLSLMNLRGGVSRVGQRQR